MARKRKQQADQTDPAEDRRPTEPEAHGAGSSTEDLESLEPIELSDEAAELVEALQRERDEAVEARRRALADYANFQRRAGENEARARTDGQLEVIRNLLPVLDHFDLALNQDTEKVTAEQLVGGVRIVYQELIKALENFGVTKIEPEPGEEFNPNRHEAMMRQSQEGIAPNTIVAVMQPGFAAGDRVIRPAKVAVAPEAEEAQETGQRDQRTEASDS